MVNDSLLIFFDTEFTELGIDPRLISIGFISIDGKREFYAELSDTYQLADCSDFAREVVIPLLEKGAKMITMSELSKQIYGWLESFEIPVRLVTDSISWDWPWIQEIFFETNEWPKNLEKTPLKLNQSFKFNKSIEHSFQTGLRRHHSLDDAKANRIAYLETLAN